MADPHEILHEALSHKYELLDVVGEGGMGTVYLARDRKHDRKVAVKTIHPHLATTEVRDRFEREIQITAHLQHPHILPLLDSGVAGDTLYYVMPYVEGESLGQRLQRDGALPARDVVQIGQQVGAALEYAHRRDVVHRDIKPENILLTGDQAIVADFGISKAVGEAAETALTRSGALIGTPAYMAPEQFGGGATRRSDVYALGAVLYEAVTGKRWVLGAAVDEAEWSDVDSRLRSALSRALAASPGDRWPDAGALRAALAGDSLGDTNGGLPGGDGEKRRVLRWVAAVLVVGVLFTGSVLAARFTSAPDRAESQPEAEAAAGARIDRMAVLPLTNLTNDPDQEYFVQGMHDALISELAEAGVAVIARTSVMRYRDTEKAAREIASELNVDAIVEASVFRVGDSVGIQARLVNASTEESVWSGSYDADLRNVLAVFRGVTRAIAEEIQLVLTPETQAQLARAQPVDPEAYEDYLRGRFHRQRLTPADLQAGLQYLEAALERDPGFAMAEVEIARTWIALQQFGLSPPSEATPKAKAAALRALELDGTLAEAHAALATVRTWGEWAWEQAEPGFRRAIALNPKLPGMRISFSHFLMFTGHSEEALAQAESALELDPLNATAQSFYGMDLMFVGRTDEAIAQFQKVLLTAPDHPLAHSGLWSAFHQKQMYDEALEEVQTVYRNRGDREIVEALERGFAEGGYEAAMTLTAEISVARSRESYVAPMRIARLYAHAGNHDLTIDWLERAFEAREPNLPYIGVVPVFGGLRNDPRFVDLLRRMNLPT
jgi:serine/threonine-protein kinase